jgi:hypothetical protein
VPSGSRYNVTVLAHPSGQTCAVANGSVTAARSSVTLAVTCTPNSYSVGGAVSGLAPGRSVILRDDAAGEVTVSANGEFTFSKPLLSRSGYSVTIADDPEGQRCTVTNGSGTVMAANISDIQVACTTVAHTIGVRVRGLASTEGLVLQYNGGNDLAVPESGTFDFATPIEDEAEYEVTILTHPTGKTCLVSGGTGTVAGENVRVSVTCPWEVVYVAVAGTQFSTGELRAAYVDEKTGLLFGTESFPPITVPRISDIALGPDRKFLYVSAGAPDDTTNGTISVFSIDPVSGSLAAVPGATYAVAGAKRISGDQPWRQVPLCTDPKQPDCIRLQCRWRDGCPHGLTGESLCGWGCHPELCPDRSCRQVHLQCQWQWLLYQLNHRFRD